MGPFSFGGTRMLVWLLGTAACYLLLVGVLVVFQRALIYRPGGEPPPPAEVGLGEMSPVPLRTRDGLVVTGWYAPPARPGGGTVLFFHGNSGTIADRAGKARILLNAGFGLFLAEYRGYGGNRGSPTEAGLFADGRAALAWLFARGVPSNRLALYGESLGTGVAVHLAAEAEVAALVLEAPFTRLPDLAPPLVGATLASLVMADRFDNLAAIGGVQAPLLLLHGERDEVVPVALARRLLAAAPGEPDSLFPRDAGHNDLWRHGADEAVVDFLSRHFGRSAE